MPIKLTNAGFRELRTLPVMDRLVLRAAAAAAASLGPGFKAQPSPGKNRARAVVVPDTPEAAFESANHPARLIGSLDAARHAV